jgi:hypothetical protein
VSCLAGIQLVVPTRPCLGWAPVLPTAEVCGQRLVAGEQYCVHVQLGLRKQVGGPTTYLEVFGEFKELVEIADSSLPLDGDHPETPCCRTAEDIRADMLVESMMNLKERS